MIEGPPGLNNEAAMSLPPLERCRVFLHNPLAHAPTPARYTPSGWRGNKYAQEVHLREALVTHPWRVNSAEEADLIVLATDFSLLCAARKVNTARYQWHVLLNDTVACDGSSTGRNLMLTKGEPHCRSLPNTPRLLSLTNNDCAVPWLGWSSGTGPPSRPPDNFVFLVDHRHHKSLAKRSIVSPAVISHGPAWFLKGVDASGAVTYGEDARQRSGGELLAWESRKVLFFAGHTPKLHTHRKLRFQIWEQLRSEAGATCVSSTLNCTLGIYEVCSSRERISREYASYCYANGWECRPRDPGPPCMVRDAKTLRRHCNAYKGLDWKALLPDVRRDARRLTFPAYLAAARSHRFCLAAPGDFSSTPKITEFIAVGASGGCIPVIVVTEEVSADVVTVPRVWDTREGRIVPPAPEALVTC